MMLASDIFHQDDADRQVRAVKTWLKNQGVMEFEPVSLLCDQLQKVSIRTHLL